MEFEKKEVEYLDKTLDVLRKTVKEQEAVCDKAYEYAQELSAYNWENRAEMDLAEQASQYSAIEQHAEFTNKFQLTSLRNNRAALKSPYFGEITAKFDEDDKPEDFYIGITGVMDGDSFLVIDWRSPIASLFFNNRLGKASYKAPVGEVECELLGRKQIKIRNSELKRIVNSDVHIDDDVLQEVLAKSSSEKMRNIVSTIQEEQNNIIRNTKDRNIIVQGSAGSGKTSVGLHRLAYLLYSDKKAKSNNMLVFSPSDVFSSYISNVLPELREDNPVQTTFKDFANHFVKGFDKLESYIEFVSKYYDGLNSDEKNRLNEFKFSQEFMDALDEFIIKKSGTYALNFDLKANDDTIIKEYLNKLLASDSYKGKPLYEKIDMLSEDILGLVNRGSAKRVTAQSIKAKLESKIYKSINPKTLYNEFLSSDSFVSRYGKKDKISGKMLEYPDIVGMLYLYFGIVGYPENNVIRHVVVDEAQDYSPLQMKMIKNLFKGATFTVLGDANQTINPYHKYDSLEEMTKSIGSAKYIELNKAYRSTPEIMNYTNAFIGSNVESVRRHDNRPVITKEVSKDDLYTELVSDILDLKKQGLERICIITRNKNDAEAIKEGIKDSIDNVSVLTDEKESYGTNTLVSPAYMAKGLEFDAVISYNNKEDEYEDKDKYLYYVACTRAQHNLVVYNEPTKIKKIGGIK